MTPTLNKREDCFGLLRYDEEDRVLWVLPPLTFSGTRSTAWHWFQSSITAIIGIVVGANKDEIGSKNLWAMQASWVSGVSSIRADAGARCFRASIWRSLAGWGYPDTNNGNSDEKRPAHQILLSIGSDAMLTIPFY
jgi:hypothetical protein